jgi:hypothetical protein
MEATLSFKKYLKIINQANYLPHKTRCIIYHEPCADTGIFFFKAMLWCSFPSSQMANWLKLVFLTYVWKFCWWTMILFNMDVKPSNLHFFIFYFFIVVLRVYCGIYKYSYDTSSTSYLDLPPPPFSFIFLLPFLE